MNIQEFAKSVIGGNIEVITDKGIVRVYSYFDHAGAKTAYAESRRGVSGLSMFECPQPKINEFASKVREFSDAVFASEMNINAVTVTKEY